MELVLLTILRFVGFKSCYGDGGKVGVRHGLIISCCEILLLKVTSVLKGMT